MTCESLSDIDIRGKYFVDPSQAQAYQLGVAAAIQSFEKLCIKYSAMNSNVCIEDVKAQLSTITRQLNQSDLMPGQYASDKQETNKQEMGNQKKIKEISGCALSMNEVFQLIKVEREHQDKKWGSLKDKRQSVAGYLLVIEGELREAKEGWLKNVVGKHSSLSELIQLAATAVACLQQHGKEGNPM